MSKNIPKNLSWMFERNIIHNYTSLSTLSDLIKNKNKVYIGFDITKPSLQLGNMVCLNVGELLMEKGLQVYIVLGGGTTLIGDPSGKYNERELITKNILEKNLLQIQNYLRKYFPKFIILNNITWLGELKLIHFLRFCKNVGMNYLLDRQLIRERLNTKGMSYTEFSYTLLQGWDYYFLATTKNIVIQFGGSDQWGNLLTGHDLIKKTTKIKSSCFSIPLLLDEHMNKFGKTEKNALFLDKKETSSYEIYQAIINLPDSLLQDFYYKLTNISSLKIKKIIENHLVNKSKKIAHHQLAKNIIGRIRSNEEYLRIKKVNTLLFNHIYNELTKEDFTNLINSSLFKGDFIKKIKLDSLLVKISFASSLSEARRLILSQGIKVNKNLVCGKDETLENFKPYLHKFYIISKGKKTFALITLK